MRPPLPIGTHGEINTTKQPNGKWKARAYYRDTTGRRRDITASAPTKAAAVTRLKEKVATYQPAEQTLSQAKLLDFTEKWYETYKKDKGLSTLSQTRATIERHIASVGDKRLNEITVPWLDEQIQKWANPIMDGYQKIGGPTAARRLRTTYKMVLAEAVRQGALQDNPAEKTRPVHIERPPVKALSPEDLTRMRKHVRDFYDTYPHWTRAKTWLPDLIDFMVGTGCRVGEAIAIRWEDINLETGLCTIRATALSVRGASIYQPFTKTRENRAVVLPDWLVLTLISRGPKPEGFVFTVKDGGMAKYSTLKDGFKRGLPEDMEGMNLKIIRSSVATMIEREMGLEAAGLQLGHDDFKTTKKFYIERRGVSNAADVLGRL